MTPVLPLALRGSRLTHHLDHCLSPALVLFSLTPDRAPPPPSEVSTIAILQTGPIGDTVVSSAFVQDARKHYPAAELLLVVTDTNLQAAELIPGVDRLLEIDPLRFWKARRTIVAWRPDVAVDLAPWTRFSALLVSSVPDAVAVGYRTPGQHKHYGFDRVAQHSDHRHEIDNLRALGGTLRFETAASPTLVVPEHPEVRAGRPEVVIHAWAAGSGKRLKEWPGENWVRVVSEIHELGYGVALTGGPADREDTRELLKRITARVPEARVRDLSGRLDLGQTADVLRTAELVVSVNTGIMHIAGILDTPLIALHGPTDPGRWGPVDPDGVNVTPPSPECGYLSLGFEYPRSPPVCMEAIEPSTVVGHVTDLLAPVR